MWIGKVLRYVWYWITGLLFLCAKILSVGTMICVSLVLIFILAAQLTRYARSSEWHPVPISELLEILRIEMPPSGVVGFQNIVGFLLDLPATLSLFLAAMFLYSIKKLLDKVEGWRQRNHPRNAGRQDMIKAIEHALGDQNK